MIGPGLGREDYMLTFAKLALNLAKERGMYVVIDADGLYMVGQDVAVIKGYRRAVLTPNVVEFKRLSELVVRTTPRSVIAQSLFSFLQSVNADGMAHVHLRAGYRPKHSRAGAGYARLSSAGRRHGAAEGQRR